MTTVVARGRALGVAVRTGSRTEVIFVILSSGMS
jgi:hypothetical protein